MDYLKTVEQIPNEKRQTLTNKLVDCILTSKSEEKMPPPLANDILHHWQKGILDAGNGLAALLQASVLLEPDKTVIAFNELQMTDIAEQIKDAIKKPE